MPNNKIQWDKTASCQFEEAIDYIFRQSVQSAEKVSEGILEKIERLKDFPEANPLDKYKKDNDGYYRAFELHRLRISYWISGEEIRIIRVRSTYREPLSY